MCKIIYEYSCRCFLSQDCCSVGYGSCTEDRFCASTMIIFCLYSINATWWSSVVHCALKGYSNVETYNEHGFWRFASMYSSAILLQTGGMFGMLAIWHVGHLACCLWHVAYLACCLFGMLPIWHVAFLACCLFGILPIWHLAYLACCLFDMLPIWYVAYLACCLFGMLPIWHVAYLACCPFGMLTI
jgi:hypothetical protein